MSVRLVKKLVLWAFELKENTLYRTLFLEMHKTKTKEITPANRSIRKLNNAMPTSRTSKKQVRDWFQLNKRVQPGAPNEKN